MSEKEFTEILHKIKPYTNYIYLHVLGEPLMHPYLLNLITIAFNLGFKTTITTNGQLINKYIKNIEILKKLYRINFSLHSYDKDNIEQFLKDIFTLTSAIKDTTYISYRYWLVNKKDKKLDIIYTNIISEYKLDADKQNELYNQNSIKLCKNVYFNKDFEFIWPSLDNSYYNEVGTCYGTRDHIGILSDGSIIPCCLLSNKEIVLGNIFQDNINDIIKGNRFNNMKQGFLNNKKVENICKHCNFIDRREIINK